MDDISEELAACIFNFLVTMMFLFLTYYQQFSNFGVYELYF